MKEELLDKVENIVAKAEHFLPLSVFSKNVYCRGVRKCLYMSNGLENNVAFRWLKYDFDKKLKTL